MQTVTNQIVDLCMVDGSMNPTTTLPLFHIKAVATRSGNSTKDSMLSEHATTTASPLLFTPTTRGSISHRVPPPASSERPAVYRDTVIQHKLYVDHALEAEDIDSPSSVRYNCQSSFPMKLHQLLQYVETEGLESIVSWQPNGRCFRIHEKQVFVDRILPRFFRLTKIKSFQRQLNLYGFQLLTHGPDTGGYYHEYFLKGRVFLCKYMIRTKIKGTVTRRAHNPEDEPNFYCIAPVTVVKLTTVRPVAMVQDKDNGPVTKRTERSSVHTTAFNGDGIGEDTKASFHSSTELQQLREQQVGHQTGVEDYTHTSLHCNDLPGTNIAIIYILDHLLRQHQVGQAHLLLSEMDTQGLLLGNGLSPALATGGTNGYHQQSAGCPMPVTEVGDETHTSTSLHHSEPPNIETTIDSLVSVWRQPQGGQTHFPAATDGDAIRALVNGRYHPDIDLALAALASTQR